MIRIACIAFVICSIGSYLTTAYIGVINGYAATLTKQGQFIIPIIMGMVSVFTFSLTCAVGHWWRKGAQVAAALGFLFAACLTSYSTWNVVGFLSQETLGRARLAETRNQEAKDLTKTANEQTIQSRKETDAWLKKTFTTTAKPADKEKILDKITSLAETPVPLKKAEVEDIAADVRTEAMHEVLGIDQKTAVKASAIALAAFLVLFELTGTTLGFALWPRPSSDGQRQKGNRGFSKENDGISASSVKMVSIDDALQDLRLIHPKTPHPITVSFLKDRWGIKRQTVHYRLGVWESAKIIGTKKTSDGETYVSHVSPLRVVSSNNDLKASA